MTSATTLSGREIGWRDALSGLVLFAGLGLVSGGSYLHLTIAAQVRAGNCDGCEPWHPLLIIAPLAAGVVLVSLGGYLLFRG